MDTTFDEWVPAANRMTADTPTSTNSLRLTHICQYLTHKVLGRERVYNLVNYMKAKLGTKEITYSVTELCRCTSEYHEPD
jgi:hypothetical protein